MPEEKLSLRELYEQTITTRAERDEYDGDGIEAEFDPYEDDDADCFCD